MCVCVCVLSSVGCLQSMGFTSSLSELALKEYKTVQAAIDAILAGKG